jgi:hypothetical protein
MWNGKYPHDHLDGVLESDTVTLRYLLRAIGPVKVPGGVTLTDANATDELLNKAYIRINNPPAEDVFFAAVARRIFDKVSSGAASPSGLVSALSQSVGEGRIHVHLTDTALQRQIASSQIGGHLSFSATAPPQLALYLNDATGAKMSYYLTTSMTTHSDDCNQGRQTLTSAASFHEADIPAAAMRTNYIVGRGYSATPPGQQLIIFRVFSPVGGGLGNFRFNGKKYYVRVLADRNRAVAVGVVQLKPRQTVVMTWTTNTGPGASGNVTQILTPGLMPRPLANTVASAC